jgi:hypothetical protein
MFSLVHLYSFYKSTHPSHSDDPGDLDLENAGNVVATDAVNRADFYVTMQCEFVDKLLSRTCSNVYLVFVVVLLF